MTVRVAHDVLRGLVRECFSGIGVPERDARAVAEVLVEANLRGNDSHGLARAPTYMARVGRGAAGGSDRMREVVAAGPLVRLDAGAALGPAAAVRATDRATELAGQHGIGLVAVGNSSHLGAAGFYARRMVREGLAAMVATNGPANMAPHGSNERFLGTNALAVGVPAGSRGAVVVDMSSSAVARGKLIRARELGQAIEPGLAVDREGRPVTDPGAALAGAVLPFAGPKGAGLALVISMLVAVLGGAGFDHEVTPMHGGGDEPQRVGHLFLAIDPWRLADRQEADARVEDLIDRLHALRPAAGFDHVLYPGERGDLEAETRARAGIPIEPEELRALERACRELGLDDLARRAHALAEKGGP